MLKDTTAIIIHHSNQAVLHKALTSLEKISSRLGSIIILHEQSIIKNYDYQWINDLQYIAVKHNDFGKSLNEIIRNVNSMYVLILQDTDYLSSITSTDFFRLPDSKHVLTTSYYNQNIVIHRPVMVRTSLIKRQPFLSSSQLPFKEALLTAWLSTIDDSFKIYKEGLLKQTKVNSSTSIIEKGKISQKYQLKKGETDLPSLSIIIANYNMEKYVETAIVSCLLQKEKPDQILIIDDGSTDSSYKKIQRWGKEKKVTIFKKKNEGKAKALNHLLPHVTSDFILELDADDWLDPDAISVIKQYLSELPNDISVLYGNLRKWKQLPNDIIYKKVAKGRNVYGKADLLQYHFPLGPRIYRTSTLQSNDGFPVIEFEGGRLYEDVSVLSRLINSSRFCYKDFTVYNVREHKESITKNNLSKWKHFKKTLKH